MNILIYFFNLFFVGFYKYKESYVYVILGICFVVVFLRIGFVGEIIVFLLIILKLWIFVN